MTRHVSSREARSHFSELTERVRYTGEPVIVEKPGQPFVAIVSLDDLDGGSGSSTASSQRCVVRWPRPDCLSSSSRRCGSHNRLGSARPGTRGCDAIASRIPSTTRFGSAWYLRGNARRRGWRRYIGAGRSRGDRSAARTSVGRVGAACLRAPHDAGGVASTHVAFDMPTICAGS